MEGDVIFSDFFDRSSLDELEDQFFKLASRMEGQDYHRIHVINALQKTIETLLERQGWQDANLYWRKMKVQADAWHSYGEEWKAEEQARRDTERAKEKVSGRKNNRGQSLH